MLDRADRLIFRDMWASGKLAEQELDILQLGSAVGHAEQIQQHFQDTLDMRWYKLNQPEAKVTGSATTVKMYKTTSHMTQYVVNSLNPGKTDKYCFDPELGSPLRGTLMPPDHLSAMPDAVRTEVTRLRTKLLKAGITCLVEVLGIITETATRYHVLIQLPTREEPTDIFISKHKSTQFSAGRWMSHGNFVIPGGGQGNIYAREVRGFGVRQEIALFQDMYWNYIQAISGTTRADHHRMYLSAKRFGDTEAGRVQDMTAETGYGSGTTLWGVVKGGWGKKEGAFVNDTTIMKDHRIGHDSHQDASMKWKELWGETVFRWSATGEEQFYIPLIKAMPMGTLLHLEQIHSFGDGISEGGRDLDYPH